MRAAGGVARQLEHLRPDRREHPPVAGHGGGDGVQVVEVPAGHLQRLLVLARVGLLDEQRVADANAEQRAVRVIGLQRGEPRAHLVGGVHPEVQDAGGGDDGRGRVEKRAQRAEHVAAGVGDPQRGVAE